MNTAMLDKRPLSIHLLSMNRKPQIVPFQVTYEDVNVEEEESDGDDLYVAAAKARFDDWSPPRLVLGTNRENNHRRPNTVIKIPPLPVLRFDDDDIFQENIQETEIYCHTTEIKKKY